MNIFLTQSPNLGNVKGFLLCQLLGKIAEQQNHQVVKEPSLADVVLIFGKTLPNNTALLGKKVALINPEEVFANPERIFANALNNIVDYEQPETHSLGLTGNNIKNIVAVTACPTGVAHTFMSAEAIEAYAKQQGWNVKVETRGQGGVKNIITPEEVEAADLVFVAADINIDLSKFQGKAMYRTSTGLALKKTAQEFEKAFATAKPYQGDANQANTEQSTEKKGVYQHLMSGVSYMLPFVVAGGLLITISWLMGGIYVGDDANTGTLAHSLNKIGGTAFGLMIAAFAGYVAYSIADRPGLAVGFVGGMLANNAGAGILGGIIAGFLAGYTVKALNKIIKLPVSLTSLKPILLLPLIGAAIVGLLMINFLNPPVAAAMTGLTKWLGSLGSINALIFGALLGGMMCVDMGGPINKAAYMFGTGLIASQITTPMAAVMAGGMVPPIGMAIATILARNKFTTNQRDAGKASFVLGLCFISEGALPFVAADPVRVIISSVLGGATAGAIAMNLDIGLPAPHGGLFVVPLVSNPLMYVVAIAAGSLVTGIIYSVIKPKFVE